MLHNHRLTRGEWDEKFPYTIYTLRRKEPQNARGGITNDRAGKGANYPIRGDAIRPIAQTVMQTVM